LNNFEKTIGLRLLTLNDDASSDAECKNDPVKDVQLFREKSRQTFHDIKKKHRDVMGNIRMREHESISRLASAKPSKRIDNSSVSAYDRIN
jgi:hypothetical protein